MRLVTSQLGTYTKQRYLTQWFLGLSYAGLRVGLEDPCGFLLTQIILWICFNFCDSVTALVLWCWVRRKECLQRKKWAGKECHHPTSTPCLSLRPRQIYQLAKSEDCQKPMRNHGKYWNVDPAILPAQEMLENIRCWYLLWEKGDLDRDKVLRISDPPTRQEEQPWLPLDTPSIFSIPAPCYWETSSPSEGSFIQWLISATFNWK